MMAQLEESISEAIVDSGASRHMVKDKSLFVKKTRAVKTHVTTAGSETLQARGEGECIVQLGNTNSCTKLTEVLQVPGIHMNLISVGRLCDDGCNVMFTKDGVYISRAGKVIGTGHREGGIYTVEMTKIAQANIANAATRRDAASNISAMNLWHHRLGHADRNSIARTEKLGATRGLDLTDRPQSAVCEPCVIGKMTNGPLKPRLNLCDVPGVVVHTDLGHISWLSFSGAKYFVTFLDEASGHIVAHAIKRKNESAHHLIRHVAWVERQSGARVAKVVMDGASKGDYAAAVQLLEADGIEFDVSAPYTPAENGRAERINRTLIGAVRASLAHAGLPKEFWAECLANVVYVRNAILKTGKKKTPTELLTGTPPYVGHLRIFGCRVWTRVQDKKRKKLEPKAKPGILMRSLSYGKYRIWLESEKKVVISRHCRIVETEFPALKWRRPQNGGNSNVQFHYLNDHDASCHDGPYEVDTTSGGEDSISVPVSCGGNGGGDTGHIVLPEQEADDARTSPRPSEGDESRVSVHGQNVNNDTPDDQSITTSNSDVVVQQDLPQHGMPEHNETPRYPSRARRKPVRFQDFAGMALDDIVPYKTAMEGTEAEQWTLALQEEMDAIISSGTLVPSKLPDGRVAISTKFLFKRKLGVDGLVKRYKARLVVHGNLQREGIDFEETYAPVVDWEVAMCAISLMLRRGARIELVDFITAFLNGDIEEDVYVKLPKSYDASQRVYKLAKSLYGLRQSPRNWYLKLTKALHALGFKSIDAAECVYTKGEGRKLVVLLVYVDDMVIMSIDKGDLVATKKSLKKDFKITDLGPLAHFLGVKFDRDGNTMKLSQAAYVERVLERFGMSESRPAPTPMVQDFTNISSRLASSEEERLEMAKVPYRQAVGSLLYLARHTRPDICFAVSALCRVAHDPGRHHWVAAKRIMRYLRATPHHGVPLGDVDETKGALVAYSDADWAGDATDRKSTSGYLIMLHGAVVAWRSSKQTIVALSSTEAEYVALSDCCRVVARVRNLLNALGEPITRALVYEDNTSTMRWTEKGGMRTKHIDVKRHYIRGAVERNEVQVQYCPTDDMLADPMTKPLGRDKVSKFVRDIGMEDAGSGVVEEEC